jgi:hypothetical protein
MVRALSSLERGERLRGRVERVLRWAAIRRIDLRAAGKWQHKRKTPEFVRIQGFF